MKRKIWWRAVAEFVVFWVVINEALSSKGD